MIVSAFDGTKAVFSEGELDRALGAAEALIALRQDGENLPPGRGRFRLVSPSTVEYHLRKAFRKLDVRSRTQLSRRLG